MSHHGSQESLEPAHVPPWLPRIARSLFRAGECCITLRSRYIVVAQRVCQRGNVHPCGEDEEATIRLITLEDVIMEAHAWHHVPTAETLPFVAHRRCTCL